MTKDPEMTLEKAQRIAGTKYPSIYWDGISPERFLAIQALAEGFIKGHAAASKRVEELENALKEAVEALSNLYEFAEQTEDCGPQGEGWQSDKLISALRKSCDVLESARRVLP